MSEAILDPVAVDQVRRATAAAMAGEAGAAHPSADVAWDEVDTEAFLQAAGIHRVTEALVPWLDAMEVPDSIAIPLRLMARDDAMRALRLASESTRAMAALQSSDVPALLFKGIALSMQTTGSLASRGAGDIDLLVRPEDVPRAHDALTAAGWDGEPIPDAPRWWAHYLRARRERSYQRPASVIDLHWRVGWHRRPLPSAAELIARRSEVRIGDADIPTLWLPDAFALACYTPVIDRFARLRSLVDVVRFARRGDVVLPPGTDWRLRRVVGETVALADHLLGGIPDAGHYAPPGSVDLDRLLRIWQVSSVRRPWIDDDLSLPEIVGVYRDSARLGGAPAAATMALVDGLLPPERVPPGMGLPGIATAMGAEVADLVRTRVTRTPPAGG